MDVIQYLMYGPFLQVHSNTFRKWPGLKMKTNKALGVESSKKKRKLFEDDEEDGEGALSLVTQNSGGRGGSLERDMRREYSSELGDDSP
jgi:hypothetical protein